MYCTLRVVLYCIVCISSLWKTELNRIAQSIRSIQCVFFVRNTRTISLLFHSDFDETKFVSAPLIPVYSDNSILLERDRASESEVQ